MDCGVAVAIKRSADTGCVSRGQLYGRRSPCAYGIRTRTNQRADECLKRSAQMKKGKIHISHLLRPHWKALSIAFLAVIGESGTDLLEPWPLKIIFDYVLGSKQMPAWMAGLVHSTFGEGALAVLSFAALAVIAIAVVGAISSYTEDYLTTSVGQWVMHDLRRTVEHHIQRLSLAYHGKKRNGDLIILRMDE